METIESLNVLCSLHIIRLSKNIKLCSNNI